MRAKRISPAGLVRLAERLHPGAGAAIVQRVLIPRGIDPLSEDRRLTEMILRSALIWSRTPEGYSWWYDLYTKLRKFLRSEMDDPERANLELTAGLRRRK